MQTIEYITIHHFAKLVRFMTDLIWHLLPHFQLFVNCKYRGYLFVRVVGVDVLVRQPQQGDVVARVGVSVQVVAQFSQSETLLHRLVKLKQRSRNALENLSLSPLG